MACIERSLITKDAKRPRRQALAVLKPLFALLGVAGAWFFFYGIGQVLLTISTGKPK